MQSLTAKEIQSKIERKNGELRLDHRIFCQGLELENSTDYRRKVLEKYEDHFAKLGVVFKSIQDTGEIIWFLNEDQINFAGTLARNTEQAVEFKLRLVQAFKLAREQAQEKSKPRLKVAPRRRSPKQYMAIASAAFNLIPGIDPIRRAAATAGRMAIEYPDLAPLMADVISSLPSVPASEQSFTPTEIGQMMEPKISNIATNLKIEAAGLQESYRTASGKKRWRVLPAGEPFAVVTLESKANGDPIEHVRWKRSVIDQISIRLLSAGGT